MVSKSKNLTVTDLFAKQLMQLKGVSGEKAEAIVQQFSTPMALSIHYDELTNEQEKINTLTNLQYGKSKRKLGSVISALIYNLFCDTKYEFS